jgi:hypothetical protein
MRRCPKCGNELVPHYDRMEHFCQSCGALFTDRALYEHEGAQIGWLIPSARGQTFDWTCGRHAHLTREGAERCLLRSTCPDCLSIGSHGVNCGAVST